MNWKETHSGQYEKIAGIAERSLGWCNARDFLREIKGIDGSIQ